MKIAIITAIYDHYDSLKPVLPQETGGDEVEWVCVTDYAPPQGAPQGWRIVHEPKPGVHPNLAAKTPKFFPWNYTDADMSVWIDASYRVTSPAFAQDMAAVVHSEPLAQFLHPWRDCLYDEAEASAALPKYSGLMVRAQAQAYREAGHPEHWGLWATGVIARWHCQEVKNLGSLWMFENSLWTYQDQISQPHVLRLLDLRPETLPGDHLTNPWLKYEGSARH